MDPWIFLGVGASALAAACAAYALRARAAAVRARLGARIAVRREAAALAAARDLVAASRESPAAVLAALRRAILATVPQIEAIALFERRGDQLRSVPADGGLASSRDAVIGLAEPAAVATAARAGHRILARGAGTLAVPLRDGERVFAVLSASSPRDLPPAAVEAVVTLVEQGVPALLLARERAEDRSRATVDALTGLLTPRAFRERVKAVLERARADAGARIALLFIDSDRFKECNDRCGHAAGDLVLRTLGDILREHALDPGDAAARNGGDEFCVLFAGAEKSRAIARAGALRAAIAAYPWDELLADRGADALAITASIGVAAYPRDARSADELLEKADAAMYHSKHAGRDRVSYYRDDGTLAEEHARTAGGAECV